MKEHYRNTELHIQKNQEFLKVTTVLQMHWEEARNTHGHPGLHGLHPDREFTCVRVTGFTTFVANMSVVAFSPECDAGGCGGGGGVGGLRCPARSARLLRKRRAHQAWWWTHISPNTNP